MQEHLNRELRTRGMDPTVTQPLQLQDCLPIDGSRYWINGLLTGLQRSELYLHRGGTPTSSTTTRQLLSDSTLTVEAIARLRRWGITTWADLLTPEGQITQELQNVLPPGLHVPGNMEIEPPYLRQGRFWYKAVAADSMIQVIEIMEVQETRYQYRVWHDAVPGMRHAVGRSVVWEAPQINVSSEEWGMARLVDTNQLTHRLLMGERKGFGRRRWSRTIQGAYRSICPAAYSTRESQQTEDEMFTQLQLLKDQLQLLGPYIIYTDGEWEYGGEGMGWMHHSTRTQTVRATKGEEALSSSRRICGASKTTCSAQWIRTSKL
jgi:hypothetical protein